MIVLPLLSFLMSPLLSLALLCYLSELCRERVLGPVGIRPVIPEDADWWEVYHLPDANEAQGGWSLEVIQERDRRLGVRLERSWYPITDRQRRRQVFDDALAAWRQQEQHRAASGRTHAHAHESPGSSGARSGPRASGATGAQPTVEGWWVVLGVARSAPWSEVQRTYRVLISRHGAYLRGTATAEEAARSHPAMLKLNQAFKEARRETGNV